MSGAEQALAVFAVAFVAGMGWRAGDGAYSAIRRLFVSESGEL